MIPQKIVARLRVGRAWTVELHGGLGFAAGRLGTWLGVRETAVGPVLRVEVRLARGVADAAPLWDFVRERQRQEVLLGRWVHDPDTGVLALVAELPITGGASCVPTLARCVAELVYEAEAMAAIGVPELELGAATALTAINGRLRDRPHRIATHLRVAKSGRTTVETVLDEARTALRARPGEHTCAIRLDRHPRLGWGVRLAAAPGDAVWRPKETGGWGNISTGDGFVTRLNRLDEQFATFAPGRWAFDQNGVTYRLFLSAAVLDTGGAHAVEAVIALAEAVAVRALPPTSARSGPLLVATSWPGDDTAGQDTAGQDACPFDAADIPEHPNRLTAYELYRDRPVDKPGSLAGTVVLVEVSDVDDDRLYVIPESWARGELRGYATLCHARTYRDVLVDDDAVETVVAALERRLEDDEPEEGDEAEGGVDARELFARRVAEDARFDTDAVFGVEGWRDWIPSAEESSAWFAESKVPVLWSRFKRVDGAWGIDYDPTDYLPAEDRERILAELRVLGCEIRECPGLVRLYWDPDPDLVARIDAGEWPPRPEAPKPAPAYDRSEEPA
ncbi:hypothetical protein [Sphaerimonospora thailandensis]|uniref:Uncharacterized protein n=1 Tax=Sphaerimonospora thailandensis TaxID=795644 RepID=A0A8J3R5S0_9ACTN|nr:hypothetical protein [Sphaerimonospora thailandensis]GIH68004.1 hypothetical protein Mth01_02570 [Sphaerimonospora thailandensis]